MKDAVSVLALDNSGNGDVQEVYSRRNKSHLNVKSVVLNNGHASMWRNQLYRAYCVVRLALTGRLGRDSVK